MNEKIFNALVQGMQIMGSMSWAEWARGVIGFCIVLLIWSLVTKKVKFGLKFEIGSQSEK